MTSRHETMLTVVLLAACVGSAAVATVSRLAARPTAVVHQTADLTVAVHGEVVVPGTYRLPWGARVADLLEAAGGVTPAADLALVAPASALTDGRTVVVPSARSPEGDGRIDLNTASARLLSTLPGVGPVTAAHIIARRPFHRLDDLLDVPGIGPVRLEALRDRVTL